MKKIFTLCLSLVFVSFVSFGQQPGSADDNPDAAQIVFDTEVLDFGTIDQGADGNRQFVFTNTGKEPLIITKCKGSCGCTVPKCPKEPILAGEQGVIKVKYDTKRIGSFTKTITVSSNATDPLKVIKIKGKVNQVDGFNANDHKGHDHSKGGHDHDHGHDHGAVDHATPTSPVLQLGGSPTDDE